MPARLRRFEQEALAVARLAHPNIVAVHDIGTSDGSPYLVTELLEGTTLREKMNGRPMPAQQGRSTTCDANCATALAAAHERRHRPPRHQAGEPVRHSRGAGQDSRFRNSQAD